MIKLDIIQTVSL